MEYNVGDIIKMKKPHPCGSRRWKVLRVGVDWKLQCTGCGHEIMVPRVKLIKQVKSVEKNLENQSEN